MSEREDHSPPRNKYNDDRRRENRDNRDDRRNREERRDERRDDRDRNDRRDYNREDRRDDRRDNRRDDRRDHRRDDRKSHKSDDENSTKRQREYSPVRGQKKPKWRHEEEPNLDKQKWGKESSSEEVIEKEEPNFEASGLLTKEFKTLNGVDLVYVECEDGRKPTTKWRLYPIKDNNPLPPIPIHVKSYYLIGRDRKVADIPLDHPSVSKQHAVIQFRTVTVIDDVGLPKKINKPYLMDLGSTNGVFLNGSKLDIHRYVELIEKDILKFGNSSRDYVLLHEESN